MATAAAGTRSAQAPGTAVLAPAPAPALVVPAAAVVLAPMPAAVTAVDTAASAVLVAVPTAPTFLTSFSTLFSASASLLLTLQLEPVAPSLATTVPQHTKKNNKLKKSGAALQKFLDFVSLITGSLRRPSIAVPGLKYAKSISPPLRDQGPLKGGPRTPLAAAVARGPAAADQHRGTRRFRHRGLRNRRGLVCVIESGGQLSFYCGRKIIFTVRRPPVLPRLHVKPNLRHFFCVVQGRGREC